MKRMRFLSACLAAFVLAATPAAFAQTGPSEPARIDDIQVSQDGETFSILVKLSRQPASATARVEGDDLVLDLTGLALAKLVLEPSPGSMIRHVEAADGKLKLSGAAFGEASAVIYRNAVVVKTKLADPKAGGASLMTARPIVPKEQPPAPPEAKQVVASVETTPALTPAIAPPSPSAKDQPVSLAKLVKLDTARCAEAAVDLKKDPWSVPALGDHALCLIDMGSAKEAGAKLDQLAAFAPEDWRVALGRAELARQKGDASNAEIGYRAAAMLAPDAEIRAAIAARYSQPASG
ncbi:MAG TPA: hypothetical protein VIA80_02420 [Hyphomonadaceae bacterium]